MMRFIPNVVYLNQHVYLAWFIRFDNYLPFENFTKMISINLSLMFFNHDWWYYFIIVDLLSKAIVIECLSVVRWRKKKETSSRKEDDMVIWLKRRKKREWSLHFLLSLTEGGNDIWFWIIIKPNEEQEKSQYDCCLVKIYPKINRYNSVYDLHVYVINK